MRKMTVSSRSSKYENACRGCSIHRPTRPRSPSPVGVSNKEEIENLLEDMEGNFQEAFQTLSSTIDTIRQSTDESSSTSMVYEDMDIDGASDANIEVEHYNGLRCNLKSCCNDSL